MKSVPPSRSSRRFRLFACACLGFVLAAFPRAPFPEAVEADPLRYGYARNDSASLEGPPVPRAVPAPRPPVSQPRVFSLPPSGRRPIRVLLQGGGRELTLFAPLGSRLKWVLPNGKRREQAFAGGVLRIELRGATLHVRAGGRRFSAPPPVSLLPEDTALALELNGKPYRGSLDLRAENGSLQCLNVLPLEEYLRGVVPLEMGHPGEGAVEALKAQAIVARTYAVKLMLARSQAAFDIRATVQDQVYGGKAAESALSDRAIRETRGQVVVHSDTLALCYYHSACGGTTAGRHEVWGGEMVPYLTMREDRDASGKPWCASSKYMKWEQAWNSDDLAVLIRHNLESAGVAALPFRRLEDLVVRDRFACGRVDTLRVKTDGGDFDLRGDKIRLALKSLKGRMLESSRFDLEIKGDRITARGSGYGHGVGLCQTGAIGRALAGQDCGTILQAYYPGTAVATSP